MIVTVVYGHEGIAQEVAAIVKQHAGNDAAMLQAIGNAMQGTTCSVAGEGVQSDGVKFTHLDCEGVVEIYISDGPMILHDLEDGDEVDVAEIG